MVRIAHLADSHLGNRQYSLEERERDVYEVFDEIGDRILEEHADIVVHSGDLFDSPRPSTQAYYAFKALVKRLDGKARFFAILGDHDKPKVRGMPPHKLFDDQVQTLGVTGNPDIQQLSVKGEKVLVAGISNLTRAYSPLLVEELKKLERLGISCDCSVLMLHQAIDKFFSFQDAWEISLADMPKNFDYYAMGHLHARVRASFGRGELAYPGSPEILRSDEIAGWKKLGKGFNVVDVESNDVKVTEINLQRIRPQFEVTLSYARFKDELEKFVKSLRRSEKLPIVHVQIEGKEVDRQAIHKALSEALAGKVLTFRHSFVEEGETKLPELKPGGFQVNQALSDYVKDPKVAELAVEMFKYLRQGDTEGAKALAAHYFDNAYKEGKSRDPEQD
jgi:DNA repair exonuclease SbcCD nuclease subunit